MHGLLGYLEATDQGEALTGAKAIWPGRVLSVWKVLKG